MRPPTINSAVAALRFFFTATLERPDLSRRLTVVREPRRLPAVLSVEEVTLLLQTALGPKYKAAFATAYGAGLRVSEVVALRVGDIDSERMLLRIEQGKGRKDRHAMLSPQLLERLREWWREGRRLGVLLPGGWLFPRPQSGRAAIDPPAQPSRSRRRRGSWIKKRCRRIPCGTSADREAPLRPVHSIVAGADLDERISPDLAGFLGPVKIAAVRRPHGR